MNAERESHAGWVVAPSPSRVASLLLKVETLQAANVALLARLEALEVNVTGLAAKVGQAEALFNKYKGKFGLFFG